ncbi:DUF4159 domain-containing protein [bacterium]|jgi:hypothetical protein|nr:hypothetical protein [Gemmatimonadota bacterium]MCH2663920.1 DUF4159 domain-containing protein [bacterium]
MRHIAAVLATLLLLPGTRLEPQDPSDRPDLLTIARLKYQGGGDWYNGPTEIPNLLAYIRNHTTIRTAMKEVRVEILDDAFFSYPIVYVTGHGNISFSEAEIRRLRRYLENGGFLIANDDYGMDKSFRREMSRLFPDKDLVELPPSFGLYKKPFPFNSLPKIHEHDGGRPQAFGIFHEGRLVVIYLYETDIGDGWDDPDVHGDPPEKRDAALRFGTNIVHWALTH